MQRDKPVFNLIELWTIEDVEHYGGRGSLVDEKVDGADLGGTFGLAKGVEPELKVLRRDLIPVERPAPVRPDHEER